jgi:Glycerophosphoryl diester phosphodiesterase family
VDEAAREEETRMQENRTFRGREAVWRELIAAEVDFINTDHLAELQSFLLANDPRPTEPYVYWNGR